MFNLKLNDFVSLIYNFNNKQTKLVQICPAVKVGKLLTVN